MSIDSTKAEEEKLSEINNDKRNYHLSILKVKNDGRLCYIDTEM